MPGEAGELWGLGEVGVKGDGRGREVLERARWSMMAQRSYKS